VGCEKAAYIRTDSGPFHGDENVITLLSKKIKKRKDDTYTNPSKTPRQYWFLVFI